MTNILLAHWPDPLALVDYVPDVPPALSLAGLTPRERDVLELLAEGLCTREVAARLAYSERTIKNVLQELMTRLQMRNRTQAVAHAVRNGWI